MFGTVPRTIWGRSYAADSRNRVATATRCLVVRGRDAAGREAVVLVDTGLGDLAAGDKFRGLYGVTDPPWRLLAELAAAGIEPAAVTHVVLTHLHFDHVGGAARAGAAGARPTFPARATWSTSGNWPTLAPPTAAAARATCRRHGNRWPMRAFSIRWRARRR